MRSSHMSMLPQMLRQIPGPVTDHLDSSRMEAKCFLPQRSRRKKAI